MYMPQVYPITSLPCSSSHVETEFITSMGDRLGFKCINGLHVILPARRHRQTEGQGSQVEM